MLLPVVRDSRSSTISLSTHPPPTVAQDELIEELTVQIARLNPMLKEGRDSTVHFLTREAADEEKRILEERLEKANEALRQKDAVIKDKDARIAALDEQRTWQTVIMRICARPLTHRARGLVVETTQADLKAEIAHSQTVQNKSTNKGLRETPRSGRAAQDTLINDPKHGVTIRLYEDLTNLIILSAKMQESPYAYLGPFEEITYKCIFSHMNTGEYRLPWRPYASVLTHDRSKSLISAHIYVPASTTCPRPVAFSS
jgi:hypothetical protein